MKETQAKKQRKRTKVTTYQELSQKIEREWPKFVETKIRIAERVTFESETKESFSEK